MKITKARLREIIKEELLSEYTKEQVRAIMRGQAPGGDDSEMFASSPDDEGAACDPEDETLDFVGILDAAIEALSGSDLANQLDCLKQQIIPASEYDEEEGSDYRRQRGDAGFMGFEEE